MTARASRDPWWKRPVALFTVAVTGHTTAAVVVTAICTMGTLGWMLAGESQSFTVTWVWDDEGMAHDVSGDGFKSEIQTEGTFSHTFEESGDYPYVCTLHSGMRGTVTVFGSA
jgi:Copper binding proteins, plastocyanin/azurin family